MKIAKPRRNELIIMKAIKININENRFYNYYEHENDY